MLLARRRADLIKDGLSIPVVLEGGEQVYWGYNTWLPADQPDELDNEEYNVILQMQNSTMRAMSIDLDFKEV